MSIDSEMDIKFLHFWSVMGFTPDENLKRTKKWTFSYVARVDMKWVIDKYIVENSPPKSLSSLGNLHQIVCVS